MKKIFSLTGALMAISATALVPAAPAAAQYYDQYRGDRYDRGGYAYDGYRDDYRRYDDRRDDYRRYDDRRYADRGYYADRRSYRGYRNYQRCDGTTGTIVGAIAGGLLGNGLAGRGDRGLGTVLGGVGGALAGRAIDKDNCRR